MSRVIGPIHLSDWLDMREARSRIKLMYNEASKYEVTINQFLTFYRHLKGKYTCE